MKYYEILDVPPDATPEQIKAAYRILVQLHHPDRLQQSNPGVRQYAEERLKKINEAYTVLSDPAKRTKYDAAFTRAQPKAYAYDDEPEEAWPPAARRSKRPYTAEQAAAREWVRQQKEREAEAQAAERARRREQAAAREHREAEEKAKRAAEEQFPRARAQDNALVLTLAQGVWTTLVRVPAGDFLMGSDPARDPAALAPEQPQHRVYVSEFFIGQYPVTNAQYQIFLDATGYPLPAPLPAGQETHPVVNISWDDAVAFCKWLSAATGRAFRLPTEAEWEKAARGPSTSSGDGRIYPWGDAWDAARLNAAGARGGPTPVGQYSPAGDSPYGLADMSGNVWEWCADWYAEKEYTRHGADVARDARGPDEGEGCVVRGGAFDASPRHVRCAHRNWYYPFNARRNVGFRVAAAL